MRIFYASDSTPNSSFESNLWRNNLYMPLVDLGHDVVEFQHDLRETFQNLDHSDPRQQRFIAKNRPKVSKALLEQIKTAHIKKPIDLFFSYFYDACILPGAIDEIRAMGIKTVNWYCNGSYQLHLVAQISPHYDWCLVPEKFRLKDYMALGARPVYCQEAANPYIYKPYDLPMEFDVTFVGQAYGDRPAYIRYLVDQKIATMVWGFGWQYFSEDGREKSGKYGVNHILTIGKLLLKAEGWRIVKERVRRPAGQSLDSTSDSARNTNAPILLPKNIIGGILSDTEMVQMFSRSKINIGFSSCGETSKTNERILQVRLRDFEVPMSGGFYMVEYMEELEEFFDIGKEIVCYYSPEDLADKIHYYLKHSSERETIRNAGYQRCLRDHTWHKRFQTVFREMGLS